jgi:hypothetical protein
MQNKFGLNEAHQLDFIDKIEISDRPPHILHFDEGDPCMLFRNIRTLSGLVKGRRCWPVNAHQRVAAIPLDNREELALPYILMRKVSKDMNCAKWQVSLWFIYAGTVHRSQGMILHRTVIDLRTQFWEHGQLYIALSRVRDPENLCVLLLESSDDISSTGSSRVPLRVPVDPEVVAVVS